MTSKECLERLYKNLGCESCHNNECKFNSVKNHCDMWTETISQDLEKLDQYKQLEKQLGIDLELYVNTHLKGVYVKGMEPLWSGGQKNEIVHYAVVSFTKDYLEVCYANSHDTHCLWNPLEEYGKTWALNLEKLNND